jgi:hypothetical protein
MCQSGGRLPIEDIGSSRHFRAGSKQSGSPRSASHSAYSGFALGGLAPLLEAPGVVMSLSITERIAAPAL